MTSQILIIRRILKSVRAKNLRATIPREKMEQILLAYSLPPQKPSQP